LKWCAGNHLHFPCNDGKDLWSSDLKARLSYVAERYDDKYAMEPLYRFEIALDGHPVPLVGEAVVSEFTGMAVRRKAEEAGAEENFQCRVWKVF
jgi:hypothetical protein